MISVKAGRGSSEMEQMDRAEEGREEKLWLNYQAKCSYVMTEYFVLVHS